MRRVFAAAALLVATAAPLRGADIHVSPAGGGDGSAASPTDLQTALTTAAANGETDTILLQSGIYPAAATFTYAVATAGAESASLLVSGGWSTGFTAQTPDRSSVLDGQGARRVLKVAAQGAGADVTVTLENLTVRNGRTSEHADPPGDTGSGAGILALKLDGARLRLVLLDCTVRDNAALAGGSRGGGLAAGCELALAGCRFAGNRAGGGGGVHLADGAHAAVANCEFSGNAADHWGGAVEFWDAGAEIRNCLFEGNAAGAAPGSDGRGGALSTFDPDDAGSPRAVAVANSTFVGNRVLGSQPYGAAIYNRAQTLTVHNSIVWDNGSPGARGALHALYRESGTASAYHSDVQGGLDGTGFFDGGGVIAAQPFAADPWVHPYRLEAGSPCVDAGSNADVPAGLEADWEGEPRVFGGDDPAVRVVDMGRDEYYDGVFAVTTPAAGASWLNDGEAKAVAWTCTNVPGDVRLSLWRGSPAAGGVEAAEIAAGVPCAAQGAVWTLPAGLADGADHAVVMESLEFPALVTWNRVAVQRLRLLAPNSGGMVQGAAYTLRWQSAGLEGAAVRIELYAAGARVRTVAAAAPDTGSFVWKVPYTLAPRRNLRFRISTVAPLPAEDFSDGLLWLVPAVGLVAPNVGQAWARGTTHLVAWNYRFRPGSAVRLDLYRGGAFVRTIARNVPIGRAGRGTYRWRIPAAQAPGADYAVRVRSERFPACYDFSNRPFAITR